MVSSFLQDYISSLTPAQITPPPTQHVVLFHIYLLRPKLKKEFLLLKAIHAFKHQPAC